MGFGRTHDKRLRETSCNGRRRSNHIFKQPAVLPLAARDRRFHFPESGCRRASCPRHCKRECGARVPAIARAQSNCINCIWFAGSIAEGGAAAFAKGGCRPRDRLRRGVAASVQTFVGSRPRREERCAASDIWGIGGRMSV